MAKVKKFKWEIDEEDSEHGVKVISLVDEPAFESEFIAFSKEKIKHKFVKLESEDKEYKQVVAGLAMIPDQEIPRVDPETNEPYVGYFDAETIEKIRNKFHKEQQDQNVNANHEEKDEVEAFMISDYIISSDLQVEDLVNKGIEEAIIGAWYVEYKIEDTETFEKVLEGEYKGFSVELYADRILESFKYNNNYKNKFSMKNLILKFKDLINEFEKEDVEVTLERAPVPELEIIIEWNEVGETVNSVITDENGEETLEPIEDGEYSLEDGRVLVVAEGLLSEIKDAPAEEPVEEEEMAEEPKAEKTTEKVIAEDEVKTEDETDKDGKKSLEELIDLSQDGYYTVEVVVEGGAISYGTVYANTYKELKFNFETAIAESKTLETEKADLEAKVVELEAKIKEPISEPKLDVEEVKEEVDLSKLSNYERIALKNGLPIV